MSVEDTQLDGDSPVDPLAFLRERRSMTKSLPDPIPRSVVGRVIEAATWAPNHRKTEPWRFVVVAGQKREDMGEVMASALQRRMAEAGEAATEEQLSKERNKLQRAPVVIVVAALPSSDPKVIEIEEVAATAAGVQNMLLAAQALGIRAMWRTGDAAYDPAVKSALGLPESSHILAFVYLGHPEIVPPVKRDGDIDSKTVWMGWT